MPGPANNRKKRKNQAKNKKKNANPSKVKVDTRPPTPPPSNPSPSPSSTQSIPTPSPSASDANFISPVLDHCQISSSTYSPQPPPLVPEKPFIYDPGNGPRVRDTRAFLNSKFFAQPPAWDIPLCAEFAQDEVLEMIQTTLPDELALILWYNKSRATSRICPACQRLYRLGDTLPEHMTLNAAPNDHSTESQPVNPRMLREQEISGLCSPVCFILSAFNYPGAIQSAWGRMGDEMDEDSWYLLNGPGDGTTHSDLSQGLGMLVKMTRLHDLGLAQLCFSDEEWGSVEEIPDQDKGVGAQVECIVVA